jgi:hypothetical protein
MNEYEKQAADFLKLTGTEFKAEFLRHGKHFDSDTESRDIYNITLKKGGREYQFNFGQSLNCSGHFKIDGDWFVTEKMEQSGTPVKSFNDSKKLRQAIYRCGAGFNSYSIIKNKDLKVPTAYDVLACLTKYDPGSFENFCSEFGYDTDSRKAEKTYNAVKQEYDNLARLFNEAELELMAEIQ